MNWFGALRNAALVVVVSSLWGCSQQDQPAEQQQSVSTVGDVRGGDAGAEPARLPAAPESLTDIQPVSDSVASDSVASDSVASDMAADVTAGQVVADDSVEGVADDSVEQAGAIDSSSAPASQPDVPPPGQVEIPSSLASVGSSESATFEKGDEREPLFVNWPQPKVALVLTGRQHGYMEPCGCSGLDNQNGGLVRRSTLIKQLTAKGWPVIPIDGGNQVRRFGRQAEIKFQITVQSLQTMGYEAISFGPDDLRLPGPELAGVIWPNPDVPSLFVSANVEVFDPDYTSAYRVIERGGKKIGITAVIGDRNQKLIDNEDVNLQPAEAGLKRVWPELARAKCDLYVLIAHATIEESVALGKAFPQFKLVVTTGGAGEPNRQPDVIKGTGNWLVEVGTKGMFAGVVALFDDPATPLRYQRIPLDARFPDSKEMLQLLAAYQDQLQAVGFEGLGVRPQPVPGGLEYVGSKICDDCHDEEYKIWSQGLNGEPAKHAHAYATLEHPPNKRGNIPRNFDPECISCHVVGWNPQKYFPYKSGFLSLETTPELKDVGCENCHGPGSRHVAAENGDLDIDDDELAAIRDSQWLDLLDAEKKCLECHDLDNSPAFQEEGAFDRYWKKIEH